MEWTSQKLAQLKALWAEGHSGTEIARRMGGLSKNAVIGKAHRLRLDPRPSPLPFGCGGPHSPVTPDEIDRAAVLWADGLGIREIGRWLKRDGKTITAMTLRHPNRFPERTRVQNRMAVGGRRETLPALPLIPAAPKQPPILAADNSSAMVRPLALTFTCRWIEGDKPNWIRCDAPITRAESYCAAHRARVYMPVSRARVAA